MLCLKGEMGIKLVSEIIKVLAERGTRNINIGNLTFPRAMHLCAKLVRTPEITLSDIRANRLKLIGDGNLLAYKYICAKARGEESIDCAEIARQIAARYNTEFSQIMLVFDGPPPAIKEETLAKRPKDNPVTHELIARLEMELKRCGVPIISVKTAPCEADPLIIGLVKNGCAEVIVSEDNDMIAYGVENVRAILRSSGGMFSVMIVFNFWNALGLSDVDVIPHIASLMGNDYCPKKNMLGPVHAIDAFREKSEREIVEMAQSCTRDRRDYMDKFSKSVKYIREEPDRLFTELVRTVPNIRERIARYYENGRPIEEDQEAVEEVYVVADDDNPPAAEEDEGSEPSEASETESIGDAEGDE